MAEFDRYANDYSGLLDESLALVGGFSDYYSRQKVALLEGVVKEIKTRSVMDFGCGIGGTTLMLSRAFPSARVVGVDISEVSIEEARRKNDKIEFGCISDEVFMGTVGSFDLIYVANVFHHIPLSERTRVVGTLKSLLSPGGKIFVFEHNPYNPVTKWIVSRCEFDRDANLLSPRESRQLFVASGFRVARPMYLLFFPHTLKFLSKLDMALKWLPIGAQYCVTASL
ncbi:MAG: class I SAM-dependent methyltransferase [Chlorobium sp.]|nr:class I SAM-dependent methyltransferase [Chlorobium sp.]